MPGPLIDTTTQGLAATLTLHQRRQDILAANIANVDTPGFRAHDLDFKKALGEAFTAALEQREAPTAAPIEDGTAPAKADGNTVDLDLEMTKLGANGGQYVTLAKILGKRITLLRQAIEGVR
jgi:flagellar basal-body rod protein FlgB